MAQADPVQDIARPRHVELMTPKPEESIWYVRDLPGMEAVHTGGQSAILRGRGDYATTHAEKNTEVDLEHLPVFSPHWV